MYHKTKYDLQCDNIIYVNLISYAHASGITPAETDKPTTANYLMSCPQYKVLPFKPDLAERDQNSRRPYFPGSDDTTHYFVLLQCFQKTRQGISLENTPA